MLHHATLRNIRNLIVICSLGLSLLAQPVIANESQPTKIVYADEDVQRAFIIDKIVERFPDDYDVMLAIAYCETRSRPFIHWEPDGSLRGHDNNESTASGTMQVLVGYHKKAIRQMGLNMQDIDDYLTFVDRLRRESPGYGAWAESRSCWKNRIGDFNPEAHIS